MVLDPLITIIVLLLISLLFIVAGMVILTDTFTKNIIKNPTRLGRITGMFFGTIFMLLGVIGLVALMHALDPR